MSFTNEQRQSFLLDVKDGRGRVVPVDGTPVATSSDETVATVDVSAVEGSPNVWNVIATGVTPGTARIVAQVDADLGPGVNTFTGFADIEVTLDERTGARMVELTPGEVTDKPIA